MTQIQRITRSNVEVLFLVIMTDKARAKGRKAEGVVLKRQFYNIVVYFLFVFLICCSNCRKKSLFLCNFFRKTFFSKPFTLKGHDEVNKRRKIDLRKQREVRQKKILYIVTRIIVGA